jgi:hypothetical protein
MNSNNIWKLTGSPMEQTCNMPLKQEQKLCEILFIKMLLSFFISFSLLTTQFQRIQLKVSVLLGCGATSLGAQHFNRVWWSHPSRVKKSMPFLMNPLTSEGKTSMLTWNVGHPSPNDIMSHPPRMETSTVPLKKPKNWHSIQLVCIGLKTKDSTYQSKPH